ncbi:MAG TPA: HAD family phosphatase [Candidatus Saccharimonadales bacterium]|nr:HAD family phosphatase [Candidatus Saccharimonadales bacterium]
MRDRPSTKRRFAVFDIDGTLYRWQLFHELVEELVKQQALADPDGLLGQTWNEWRGGKLSFHDYEHKLMHDVLYKNLVDVSVKAFDAACQAVVESSGHKVHKYTADLLKDLQDQGYFTIAISGSQQELLDRFCVRYGFDIAVGALYERQQGRFTGRLERSTFGRKAEILKELVGQYNLTFTDSLAIGDSDSDIEILELVEQPIAFNPSEGLFDRAQTAGWPIVIERKNMAYRLERNHDKLVLAKTIVL